MSARPPLLIAGCGYLGQALALRAIARGMKVGGICRSESSAQSVETAGIPALVADLTDAASIAALGRDWPPDTMIVHCAASGRGGAGDAYRGVYLEGMRNLRAAFPGASRVLFTSSTSVYPQTDGSMVTEDTPAEPERETGRILRLTEDETLAAGGTVVRLAGLYGPGRSVLLRQFLEGKSVIDVRTEAPATPDGRWVNQTHRDDAAAALLILLAEADAGACRGRVYNVADGTPMLQRTIYTELSRRFARPLPPEAPPDAGRKRGWTHKRVDASRLRALGWNPRFPSWFEALDGDAALVPSVLAQLE
jgi:nucleoside-diphosphate-sugar epimerase